VRVGSRVVAKSLESSGYPVMVDEPRRVVVAPQGRRMEDVMCAASVMAVEQAYQQNARRYNHPEALGRLHIRNTLGRVIPSPHEDG